MATEVKVFNKINRNAGTYNSNAFAAPAGANKFVIIARMDASDIIDPTLVLTWTLWASDGDENGPWYALVGPASWQGGLDIEGNAQQAPLVEYMSSSPLPAFIRGELTLSKRVSFGLDIMVG